MKRTSIEQRTHWEKKMDYWDVKAEMELAKQLAQQRQQWQAHVRNAVHSGDQILDFSEWQQMQQGNAEVRVSAWDAVEKARNRSQQN